MTVSRKTTWNLFLVAKVLVGDTSLGLPNASHLFNAAFYQPRDRTPTRLTIGSIWGTPKQSPELSDCLALKVSPAKAKTLNPWFSSKEILFHWTLFFSGGKRWDLLETNWQSQTCLLFNITMIYEVHWFMKCMENCELSKRMAPIINE